MAPDVFDRETLLDLSVNVIPLFIIVFFVIVFAAVSPFGYNAVDTTIQMALLVLPFVALAILTYYAGKAIAESEAELEARDSGVVERVADEGENGPDTTDTDTDTATTDSEHAE